MKPSLPVLRRDKGADGVGGPTHLRLVLTLPYPEKIPATLRACLILPSPSVEWVQGEARGVASVKYSPRVRKAP